MAFINGTNYLVQLFSGLPDQFNNVYLQFLLKSFKQKVQYLSKSH